jgi:hypothetical protein
MVALNLWSESEVENFQRKKTGAEFVMLTLHQSWPPRGALGTVNIH